MSQQNQTVLIGDGTLPAWQPIEKTLGEALDDAADRWSSQVGWVFEERSVTFSEMRETAEEVARAFLAGGVRRGDRVAVWLPNYFEWTLCLFACARIGAVLVALNTRWKSVEAAYALEHSQPKVLIMQHRFLNIDFQQILGEMGWPEANAFSSVDSIVEVSGNSLDAATPWNDFVAAGTTVSTERVRELGEQQYPSDDVLLQYTSGSTARPKGALVSHLQVLNYGVEPLMRLGVSRGEAFLNTQPLYHVAGSCSALPVPLTLGCKIVMPEYYEPERVLSLIESERCVSRGGTVAMYLDEMSHPSFSSFDTSSLRSAWTGAPPSVMERIRREYPLEGIVNLYAATEGGGTCGSTSDPWNKRRDTLGLPLTGTEIRICDIDTRTPVPNGQIGEICFRGWNRLTKYLGDPEKTAEAIDDEGFFHSGDLGFLDPEGYLYYKGRIKDMIRPGGENVAAEEVEAFLIQHPKIHQVAVIGAPDDRMGEVVVAIVEPTSPQEFTEEEVVSYCRGKIANFRVPKAVHFVSEWPMTSTRKISKPTLREWFGSEVASNE